VPTAMTIIDKSDYRKECEKILM